MKKTNIAIAVLLVLTIPLFPQVVQDAVDKSSSPAVLVGCNAATQKQIAKSAIDAALAACIYEHTEIEEIDALRKVCQWADEFAPLVKELLSSRTKGLAKARALQASGCGDAGK